MPIAFNLIYDLQDVYLSSSRSLCQIINFILPYVTWQDTNREPRPQSLQLRFSYRFRFGC